VAGSYPVLHADNEPLASRCEIQLRPNSFPSRIQQGDRRGRRPVAALRGALPLLVVQIGGSSERLRADECPRIALVLAMHVTCGLPFEGPQIADGRLRVWRKPSDLARRHAYTDDMAGLERTKQPAPYTHRNWNAFARGERPSETHEWPLFSDVWFTGALRDLGPYSVLNAVAISRKGHARAALVLRGGLCAKENPEENSRDCYHGGSHPDEVAALLSLCTGARL
jgi:hypothetical protein